jgi:uncharacterized protein (DUF433 family)
MQLEDYFEFEKFDWCDCILVKGTRIDIEHLLNLFLAGESAERIHQQFHRYLTLEQVYATITYYLHNKAAMDAYLDRGRVLAEQQYQEHLKTEPPEVVKRLQTLAAEQQRTNTGSA